MADIIFTGGISIGSGISVTPPLFTAPDAPTIGTPASLKCLSIFLGSIAVSGLVS